jgi:hypothetical protein
LQEYFKKEILILNNKINGLEASINALNAERRKRPSTASKPSTTVTTNDSKFGCSVSYKKLIPAPNCLSCYSSNQLVSAFGGRKAGFQKF